MRIRTPFIKKFKTNKNSYIYDINTNRILLVTPAMWDVVDYYWSKSKEEIISDFNKFHSLEELDKGYNRINELAEDYNLFSPNRLKSRVPFVTEALVRENLAKDNIQQLTLELTESCNMRCRYCSFSGGYELNRVHGFRQMSWDTAKAAVDFYINQNETAIAIEDGLSIGFYGGEPLLRFHHMRDIINYVKSLSIARSKKVRFNFTTNATLLTDEVIIFCADNQVGMTISLDGPQLAHDRNRVMKNGKGSFKRIIKNINKIHEMVPDYYDQHIRYNCVISPSSDLLALNQFFQTQPHLFRPNCVTISSVSDGNPDFIESCKPHPNRKKDNETLYKLFCDMHISGEKDPHKLTFLSPLFEPELIRLHKRYIRPEPMEHENLSPACFPGLRKLFVAVDGSFHICERINPLFSIGDISSGFDFAKITKIINDFTTILNHERCLRCEAVRFCSNCYATIDGDGTLKQPSSKRCNDALIEVENSFITYCAIWEQNKSAWDYMDDIVIK